MEHKKLEDMIIKYHNGVVGIINKRFKKDLSHYEICFNNESNEHTASCSLTEDKITYYLLSGDYHNADEHKVKMKILTTAIHELVHALCKEYELHNGFFDDYHNISFGLMCLCIENRILNNHTISYSQYNFEEEYDLFIYEDLKDKKNNKKILNLKLISKHDYESFTKEVVEYAKNVNFKTMDELAKICRDYAEYIREELLGTMTYNQWEK